MRPWATTIEFNLVGLTIVLLESWIMFRFGEHCSSSFSVLGDNSLWWESDKKLPLSTPQWATKSVEQAKYNRRERPQSAPDCQCWLARQSDHINAVEISDYEATSNWRNTQKYSIFWINIFCGYYHGIALQMYRRISNLKEYFLVKKLIKNGILAVLMVNRTPKEGKKYQYSENYDKYKLRCYL